MQNYESVLCSFRCMIYAQQAVYRANPRDSSDENGNRQHYQQVKLREAESNPQRHDERISQYDVNKTQIVLQ